MENASKALILAGSVLIVILIISLAVLIFRNFGENVKRLSNMDETEIANFNSTLTRYIGESIPGSQVNALLEYCLSVNIAAQRDWEDHKIISITLKERSFNN